MSRTVGSDRVIGPYRLTRALSDFSCLADEFIFKLTHDRVVDWLLPGVPPTGKKLEIPFVGVVNVRGDRLYHGGHVTLSWLLTILSFVLEHIWWDQASALLQAGVLPSHLPYGSEGQKLRLPVAGSEGARLLVDETDGKSNAMFGADWGVSNA